MHVTLRHLEVFHALMEAGSISRAAELLNLTQPAVSIALSKFEQELGFRLFHRSKGYFAPTSEALLLHSEAEQSLLAIERVQSRARELHAGGVGAVSIASNGACAINLLPWVIAEFQQDYPGVRIDLKVRSSRKIASWVAGRQIDIGLIDAPVPIPSLNAEIIRTPCVCILQETDPPVPGEPHHPGSPGRAFRHLHHRRSQHRPPARAHLRRARRHDRAAGIEFLFRHRPQPRAGRGRDRDRRCRERQGGPRRRGDLEAARADNIL